MTAASRTHGKKGKTPTAGRSGQSELRTVSVVFSDRYLLLLLMLPRISGSLIPY